MDITESNSNEIAVKFAKQAQVFWFAAMTLYKIKNRNTRFWIPAYYQILLALELSLKSVLILKESQYPKSHRLISLAKEAGEYKSMSIPQIFAVKDWDGPYADNGGIRYPSIKVKEPPYINFDKLERAVQDNCEFVFIETNSRYLKFNRS